MPTFTTQIIAELQRDCLNRLLFLLLGVAVPAIDRSSLSWLEGYLSLHATLSTYDGVHLSGLGGFTHAGAAPCRPALRAAAGVVLKPMRLIEFLLTDCEHEFLSAITAAKLFFFESH